MNFNDYKYEHLDLEKIKGQFSELIDSFERTENVERQIEAFDKIIKLRNHIETMQNIWMKLVQFYLDLLMIFIKHL